MIHSSIRKAALVGTDRSPELRKEMPEELLTRLSHDETPEALLLESLCYAAFQQDYSTSFEIFDGDVQEDTVREELSYAPKEFSTVFSNVVQLGQAMQGALLSEGLKIMQQNNWLIAPEMVVTLLYADNHHSQAIRSMIVEVIGNRGRKIIQYLPEQKYSLQGSSIWQEGKSEQRKQFFLDLRKTNPVSAIDLLKESWNMENVKDKVAFLQIIADTLAPTDFEFLVNTYHTAYEKKALSKISERECKQWVIHMLLRLDYAPLVEEISRLLSPYMKSHQSKSFFSKMLGSKMNELDIPVATDPVWNGPFMNTLLGLEEKNNNPKVFDTDPLFWLNGMLELFPFRFWTKLLQCDYKHAVQYFLQHDSFQTTIQGNRVPIFLQAIFGIAILTKDSELIDQLIDSGNTDFLLQIIPVMNQGQFEKFMVREKFLTRFDLHHRRTDEQSNRWTKGFTEKVMEEFIHELVHGKNSIHGSQANILALFGHESVLSLVTDVYEQYASQPWAYNWQIQIADPLQRYYHLKSYIHQYSN